MTELFESILTMSLSALWLVPLVIALRLALKRCPKWVHVLLWAMVAFRLVCPLSLESRLSLKPDPAAVVEAWADDYVGDTHFIHDASPDYQTAVDAGREPVSAGEDGTYVVTGPDKQSEPDTVENTVLPKLAILWIAGMAAMLVYTAVSFIHLRKMVSDAVRYQKNIFRSGAVVSPFVLGLLRPRIYLPAAMAEADIPHVIAHENAHIRRKDHWWKPLGFSILTVHWFNPLVWLAYCLLCRDIELACDEKVIRELDSVQKADYSQALLNCSIRHRSIAACPLAFGEVGVKQRVKSILNYKKPAFWVILLALVLCLAVAVFFLTDPVAEESQQEPAIRWFDHLENGTYPEEDADFQALLPQYPDVTFKCTPGELIARTGDSSTTLLTGMPIWNVYLCDLTGDGIAEFCATVCYGSGIIDQHVVVYDYATQTEYTLWDRGKYDYTLRLEKDMLMCDKQVYPDGAVVSSGQLMMVHSGGGEGMSLYINTKADKESSPNGVTFSYVDFSGVTSIKLENAHNGKSTVISDNDAIRDICNFLSGVSGVNGRNSKGYHYQGSYALTLMAGDEQILSIAFGDDNVFFFGDYDEKYKMMYDLDWYTIDSVIHFLYHYDESGFDWGFEETMVIVEPIPYHITSLIPADTLRADIEYLEPGDIIGYGMLREEWKDLAVLLNALMPEDFVEAVDFIPTMKINLSWTGGTMTLYSDGQQTVFGDAGSWAVSGGELNEFLNRFTLDRMTGGEQLPLEELNPYYNSEQAMIDGCVIMKDGDAQSGQNLFYDFSETAFVGKPASIRIADFSSEERFAIQVSDILYDGESFTWRAIADGQLREQHYKYLYHFNGEPKEITATYDNFNAYVLTNEKNLSWDQLWNSLYSSQGVAAMDFKLVFMDYIYYINNPSIPDCEKITLEQDGKILLTITDTDALENLFARADETYEPKTWSPGPILRLTGKDGTEVIIELGLDTDWVRIDGIYYDFGPGYDEDGAYDALSYLFSLLGIEDWPSQREPDSDTRTRFDCSEYDSLVDQGFTAGYVLYSDGTSRELRTEDLPAIHSAMRSAEVSDGSSFPTDENGILKEGMDYKIALTRTDGETMVLYCWEEDFQSLLDTGRNLFLAVNPGLTEAVSTAVENIQ